MTPENVLASFSGSNIDYSTFRDLRKGTKDGVDYIQRILVMRYKSGTLIFGYENLVSSTGTISYMKPIVDHGKERKCYAPGSEWQVLLAVNVSPESFHDVGKFVVVRETGNRIFLRKRYGANKIYRYMPVFD